MSSRCPDCPKLVTLHPHAVAQLELRKTRAGAEPMQNNAKCKHDVRGAYRDFKKVTLDNVAALAGDILVLDNRVWHRLRHLDQ